MPKLQTEAVGLFTPDEEAILANWFEAGPQESAKNNYGRLDGAFAFTVLERGEA